MHAECFCLGQHFSVWDTVLPGDAQDPPQAVQMERVKSAFLPGVHSPRLTAVKKSAEDTVLVHFHLCVGGEHAVVPHSLGQAGIAIDALPILGPHL